MNLIIRTKEDLVNSAFPVSSKWVYVDSLINYINNHTKVNIVCPIHGEFKQTPSHHLNGHGCPKCSHDKKKLSNFGHNTKYDYSKASYINSYTKVIIICPIHGEFNQTPNAHLSGQGCPKCSPTYKDLSIFVHQANNIHDNKYDYSQSIYNSSKIKINIICPIHGEFKQTPNAHLNGQGCPKCCSSISKLETIWLDSLFVPNECRNIKLSISNKTYNVDAFHNDIIFEFYGDFWHGNPRKFNLSNINPISKISFGELYKRTMEREKELKRKYKVVTIWEMDFKKRG